MVKKWYYLILQFSFYLPLRNLLKSLVFKIQPLCEKLQKTIQFLMRFNHIGAQIIDLGLEPRISEVAYSTGPSLHICIRVTTDACNAIFTLAFWTDYRELA